MSSNLETIRLQQLQMMGITSYFPRFSLPGALPSESCSWEEMKLERLQEPEITLHPAALDQDTSAVPVWHREQDMPAAEPVTARAPATPQSRTRNETKATKATKATVEIKTTKDEETAGDVLSLHLLLIPVDASLCILNQLPVLAKSLLQDKQQKLLDNILFFLGKRTADHSVRTFRWPLPGMSSITSADAARSSLMHFLEQFSLENPFSNLLIMGEQGAEWLSEARPQAETAAPPHLQWQMVQTYSLDQMLTLPAIKREVCQHLLPLQARLQQV